MQEFWAIGLMSGTALDGFVDAALIRTNGEEILELGEYVLSPYSESDREILAKSVNIALEWDFNGEEPEIFKDASDIIANIYANAVKELLEISGKAASQIDFIGAHGLTVLHRPERAKTLQLLNGQLLADLTQINTVYDLRQNDVANGGQGAPLAPIYHKAILEYAKIEPTAGFLNLGGVANITVWEGGLKLGAFDCGPANGPINELIEANGLGKFDKDGLIAKSGIIHEDIVAKVLANPWFLKPYPKSLDRYDFSAKLVKELSIDDGAATLCAIVADCIKSGLELFNIKPETLIVAGGGRRNPFLMETIQNRTGIHLINSDDIGLRGDAIEAECFAFLAVRSFLKLPISFPNTTGCKVPLTGGIIAYK